MNENAKDKDTQAKVSDHQIVAIFDVIVSTVGA